MGKAQRLFARTTVTALLALAASSAQAVPLTFAFTATVRETIIFNEFGQATFDPSHNGAAVTGAITIETDGLVRDEFVATDGTYLQFFEPNNLAVALISSVLDIGGIARDVGAYADNFGGLQVIDSSGPQPCGEGCSGLTPDQVVVFHGSTNFPRIFAPLLTGVFDTRSLTLGWSDTETNPLGLIDLSNGFEPLDVLSIPIGTLFGLFTQSVDTCVDGECVQSSSTSTNFQFGSLTVSAAQMAVPEPGTLGLFVLGLLGVGGVKKKWRSGRDSNPRPPA